MKKRSSTTTRKSASSYTAELEAVRARLEEAEETIDALRRGAVDAVVVNQDDGSTHQVVSLSGADLPYRVYVERMQEGAATVSAEGIVLFCNQRFATMAGAPVERVIGTSIIPCLGVETWARMQQVFDSEDAVVRQQAELDGGMRAARMPVLLTASELPIEGQKVMCLVVTDLRLEQENVRLRTAKETAESASIAKDQFFAVLSHELRTPLTPVLMTLANLEDDVELPERYRGDVLMMKRNIELETKLVDDLLDLNRIATGKLKLDIQAVDINDAVREACSICKSQEGNDDVLFELDLDAQAGAVAADPSRLHQVLWNVLKNAIKFTPGKGGIRVSTRRLEDGQCSVRVQDQGIGIPAASLPHIFEAFEQGGSTITRRFGGLGLGLAICKAIMDLHQGSIVAQSQGAGRGATFVVTLPSTAQGATIKRRVLSPDIHGGRPLRILVVDDHPDTLRTLARLLSGSGYEVTTASSVAGALQAAASHTFDILVSDLGLPDGDGCQVMRGVARLQDIPGIAMSGYGMDDDVRRSREAGFSDHLTKPIQFAALKRALARFAAMQAQGDDASA